MKRIFTSLFLLLVFYSSSQAPNWQWANYFDFPGSEWNSCIGGSDREGNLYLTVSSSTENHNNNTTDYYLLKLDYNGILVWSKKINEYMFGKIVTDLEGNTFIATGNKIVKISASGNVLWTKTETDKAFGGIILTSDNQLRIHGAEASGDSIRTFICTYNINGQMSSLFYVHRSAIMSTNGNSYFVAEEAFSDPITGNQGYLYKYDSLGNLIFHKSIPHTPTKILTDKTGAVYIYGWHAIFPININGTIYTTPGDYLIKYDSNGNLLWYKVIEGGLGSSNIVLDNEGNLFYSINYFSEIRFKGLDIKNSTGTFLTVKFSPGGEIKWHNIAGFSSNGAFSYASPEQIFVNAGNVYVSGTIKGTVQVGNTSVQSTGGLYTQLFVSKMDQNDLVSISENNHAENLWQIFPNPSGDIFTIKNLLLKSDHLSLTVTDVQGRVILSEQNVNAIDYKVNLSAFPNGIYLLHISNDEETTVRKLVKN